MGHARNCVTKVLCAKLKEANNAGSGFFLVERGTEELPPKSLKTLAEAFWPGWKGSEDAGLEYQKRAPLRRAAAPGGCVEQKLANTAAHRTQPMDGPPVQAAL